MEVNLDIEKINKHKSDFSDLDSEGVPDICKDNDVSDTNVGNIGNDCVVLNTLGLEEELRCTMCTNWNKSDSGCDGLCQVDERLFKAIINAINSRIETNT